MNTHIKHWHRHYQLREPHVLAWEQLASGSVLAAFEQALADVVADEREVVLLRKVSLRLTTDEPRGAHRELAVQWGRAMATAVEEALDRNDAENVQRFADTEEHFVCYLEALLTRQDAAAWYFAKWHSSESGPASDAGAELDELLNHHLDLWPNVLPRLARRQLLPQVLRRVTAPLQQRLWAVEIKQGPQAAEPPGERPVFAVALQIVESLTRGHFDASDRQEAFQAYLARPQPATDWNDVTHLAEAVYAAVCFLWDRFSCPLTVGLETSELLSKKVLAAIEPFDWLDREWLQHRLEGHVNRNKPLPSAAAGSAEAHSTIEKPSSQPARLVLRHAVWEQRWLTVERRFLAERQPGQYATAGNCLLALALVTEDHPEWVRDPALARFVEQTLAQLDSDRPADIAARLSPRDSEAIHNRLRAVPPSDATASELTGRIKSVTELQRHHTDRPAPERDRIPTHFAGVFLLSRAIHDLQLPGLARRAGFPGSAQLDSARLLCELACHWMQRSIPQEADHGLWEFAQLGGAAEWHELAMPWTSSQASVTQLFQSSLARSLIGLGTWKKPTVLQVIIQEVDVNGSTQKWLLGGDAAGHAFPWCTRWDESSDLDATIDAWRTELAGWLNQPIEISVDRTGQFVGDPSALPGAKPGIPRPLWANAARNGQSLNQQGTVWATAAVLLRHWAQGLRGMSGSSNGYLLQHFVQRSGTISRQSQSLEIELDRRPLDAVLKVSGMFDSLDFFTGKELLKISFKLLP